MRLELSIKPLTCKRLNITKGLLAFPELDSRIKAWGLQVVHEVMCFLGTSSWRLAVPPAQGSRTKVLMHFIALTAAAIDPCHASDCVRMWDRCIYFSQVDIHDLHGA